jgi:hypothetical protein
MQMEEKMKTLVLAASLALPVLASGQTATTCPTHKQGLSDDRAAGVDARGDHAMGFSHEKSSHHFRLLLDGGAIEVVAIEPDDSSTRDEIRAHLSHIAQMFIEGNFQVPHVHSRHFAARGLSDGI